MLYGLASFFCNKMIEHALYISECWTSDLLHTIFTDVSDESYMENNDTKNANGLLILYTLRIFGFKKYL